MTVTGFSFIRNAVQFDFPAVESYKSILPIVDKLVVAVGKGNDATRELISAIDPQKIVIIDTVWDEDLKSGGVVLADETNKAFNAITWQSDWCFYIQGDEVLHEKYHDPLLQSMRRWKDNPAVEGLLFDFVHFYGSYQLTGVASNWYKKEVRIIRNNKDIFSYRDAQGFRKKPSEKLRVKPAHAAMFHYGWVREPLSMQQKWINSGRFWSGDGWSEEAQKINKGPYKYDATQVLKRFTETHPEVMKERIAKANWNFDYNPHKGNLPVKERLKNLVEFITRGARPFDYKNYKLI